VNSFGEHFKAIAADLARIEQRQRPWEDINPRKINYVRAMIGRALA